MNKNIYRHLLSRDFLPWLGYYLINHSFLRNIVSDKVFLKIQFRTQCGRRLDLKDPKTFNEKLQWLKIYDHNPEYSKMVDKCEAKKYVASIIGEEYIIPTLGVWNTVEEIEWDALPKQFVLKCTHDSGGLIICKDKDNLDICNSERKLRSSILSDYYAKSREWPYKKVQPRIIAEKYMEDESGRELKDYKFFCFNGTPRYIQVDFGRFTDHHRNIYDTDWNLLDINMCYPSQRDYIIQRPASLDIMLSIASRLSQGIPFLRVDLYSIYRSIYFGELTFFPEAGRVDFDPDEWDCTLGEWIELPDKNN